MTNRIRGFDGLRAVAVVAVFLAHRSLLTFTEVGRIGVLTFFALSGFLIVGILHRSRLRIERDGSTVRSAALRFFKRRTRRIFPVFYLTLAGLAAISLAGIEIEGWRWDGLVWHALYGSNLYVGHVLGHWQPAIGHAWTLAVEEQFYLLAAPLLLFLPSRWHLTACCAIVALGMAWEVGLVALGASRVVLITDSLPNFAFLAFGGATRIWSDSREVDGRRWVWPLGALLAVLAVLPSKHAASELAVLAAPFLAGGLVLCVARAQTSRFVDLLELRPVAYMGRVSYGFYMFHNLFSLDFVGGGLMNVIASMALNFAVSLSLAAASWAFFERPILEGRWPWAPAGRAPAQAAGPAEEAGFPQS